MRKCIFCESELGPTTKPEHVLLDALGGRKTTKQAICSTCNNTFGSTIDRAVTDQVAGIRNLMRLESGSGDIAPMMRNIASGEHKINSYGDGRIDRVDKPFIINKLPDGTSNVRIQAKSPEHLQKIIPNLAAALKIPEENLRQQMIKKGQGAIVEQRAEAVHLKLEFGGKNVVRSIVKMLLVLWATVVGSDELRTPHYDLSREFVTRGSDIFFKSKTQFDSRRLEQADQLVDQFGPMFNVVYVESDSSGRVIGHFTLYNLVGWSTVLADRGGTPNTKIVLVSNPLIPSRWSDEYADNLRISAEWFAKPEYNMDDMQFRVTNVLEYYSNEYTRLEHVRLIADCFDRVGIPYGAAVPREKAFVLSQLIAQRIASHAFSLPFQENLTPEKIADLIASSGGAEGES